MQSDKFLIGIQERNIEKHFEIHKNDLNIKTFWKGGRPRVFNFLLINKSAKVIKIYGVRHYDIIKLEEIAHKLKKNANC